MEIKYLLHHEIDKIAWDDCINISKNSSIYALSWYLDLVSPDWEAIVAIDQTKYRVCFPLPVRDKVGFKYIYQPLFCQQLGLFYEQNPSPEIIDKILGRLLQEFLYIPKLSLNTTNRFAFINDPNLNLSTLVTHILPLDRPYDELRSRYHRDRKYRINQAKRLDIEIIASDDIEPLIAIFLQDTVHKIPGADDDRNYSLLRSLFREVQVNGRYELYYTCNSDGNYNCGCWFVFYDNIIIYLFNAAINKARHENGRSLIIDHVIQKYQNTDYVLDFESPEKESIASFYASFGSIPTPFYRIYYNNLPTPIKFAHRIKIKMHRQLLRWFYPNRALPDIQLP